jgi:hypothetical protein
MSPRAWPRILAALVVTLALAGHECAAPAARVSSAAAHHGSDDGDRDHHGAEIVPCEGVPAAPAAEVASASGLTAAALAPAAPTGIPGAAPGSDAGRRERAARPPLFLLRAALRI